MNAKLIALAERRALLTEQTALQRAQLSLFWNRLDQPARVADRILRVFSFLQSPLVMAGLTAVGTRMGFIRKNRKPRRLLRIWQILTAVRLLLR